MKGLRKKRRKGTKTSTAGQSQMNSKLNLHKSQTIGQNPRHFKFDSNREVPLSSMEVGKGRDRDSKEMRSLINSEVKVPRHSDGYW